jgi:hypothetical protein
MSKPYVVVINKNRYSVTELAESTPRSTWEEVKTRFDAAALANKGKYENLHIDINDQYLVLNGVDWLCRDDI